MNSLLSRRSLVTLASAVLVLPRVAQARSVAAVERELYREEKFFQPMNEPAPPFELSDPDGHQVGLKELRGKIVVLNFIYTRCPDICPLQTERLAEIQRMIKPTPLRDRVRLISITADPVHDLPEVMKAYGEQHGMDPTNWSFLTSGPNRPKATRELSAQYHNRYQLEPDGSITHGTVFHVIDSAGQWRGNFHGLQWKPEHLVMFLRALADQAAQPSKSPSLSVWRRLQKLL